MAEISVERAGDGYEVRVAEEGGESTHHVTFTEDTLGDLGAGYEDAESFLRACFEFLLAREPKEAILPRFDVRTIARYFPEFEDEIRR